MKQGSKNKKFNKGFTLLEMLVVVLIIGILAGIALPQYQKAVEKTKLTEALLDIKTIQGAAQRYILANGFPSTSVHLEDFLDVELSGGELVESVYITKYFEYDVELYPYPTGLWMEIYRTDYEYVLTKNNGYRCYTGEADMGRYICKYLETQGWEYIDGEL